MFHTYVATVCSKCFSCFSLILQQAVSCCKFKIWMFRVFHTHVASACSKCFIYFSDVYCIQMFSCCKCFMLYGRARAAPRAGGRWCCGQGMLVLSRSSRLLSVVHVEREEGLGASGGHRDGSKSACGAGEGGRTTRNIAIYDGLDMTL
jgi:hypothetical protein